MVGVGLCGGLGEEPRLIGSSVEWWISMAGTGRHAARVAVHIEQRLPPTIDDH